MESLGLALRVGLSLACVLGLVWLFSKGMLKGGRRSSGSAAAVEVLARQSLTRASSLTVVRIGERALVLGVTEQQVTLLSEADVASLAAPVPAAILPAVAPPVLPSMPASVPVQQRTTTAPVELPAAVTEARGALAGSALSPATWSQAVEALRERTTRR
jgi:flagellar protein FliO/FliZ